LNLISHVTVRASALLSTNFLNCFFNARQNLEICFS